MPITEKERKRRRLPKKCECGGLMQYEVDFGRVFSWCNTCTATTKVKIPFSTETRAHPEHR